jgi:hypothetical protein
VVALSLRSRFTQAHPADVPTQWNRLHERLGTDEATLKPLSEASKRVRHSTAEHEIALAAPRREMLDIARDVLLSEFSLLLDRDLVRIA